MSRPIRLQDATLISIGRRAAIRDLRDLRKRAGLSMADVAALIGVTESAVSLWERGLREPRRREAIRLALLYRRLSATERTIENEP